MLLKLAAVRAAIAIAASACLLQTLGARADVALVALVPPQSNTGSDSLAPALESAYKLAGQQVNDQGSLLVGNVSLNVVEASSEPAVVAELCEALGAGNSSTVAVRRHRAEGCLRFATARVNKSPDERFKDNGIDGSRPS